MRIIGSPVTIGTLQGMAKARFGNLVKAVVDIEKGVMAIDAELHADEEAALLAAGSAQENLWGINLYPEFSGKDDFVEFDSMINLRPSQHNMSRGIDSPKIRKKIRAIVSKLITP
jgi:hypothetical protein